MDYSAEIAAYKSLINLLVGSKNTPDSIEPVDVEDIGTELADLLLPILNKSNKFGISGGTAAPISGSGSEDDLYIQGGTKLIFWRKQAFVWVKLTEVDLGIQIVDGNISLQSSVKDSLVTVSPGSWAIGNIIYSKAIQSQFNLAAANANYNRIDAIYANTSNVLTLYQGVANTSPVPPVKPANTILVTYVYVPSLSSGNPPYIADSNTPAAEIQTSFSGTANPLSGSGSNGDFYYKIPEDQSNLTHYQKVTDEWVQVFELNLSSVKDKNIIKTGADVVDYELDLSAEANIPYPSNASLYVNKKQISSATWDFSSKKWSGLPDTISGDVIEAYFTGRTYVAPPYQATIIIENNSSSNVDYSVGAGTGTLLPGEDINDSAIPGASASVTIISGQNCVYTVYNEDGSVYFTHTLNGPGTENGLPMASNQSQSFIVTN